MSQTSSAVGVVGLSPPPAFLAVPGAPYQAWSAWKKSFLAFLGATGLDTVSATRKKQILFTMLGVEGQRIVDSFRLDEMPVPEGTDEFSAFLTTLEKHFEFSGSVMLERKKLFDRVQQPGESVTEFLSALRRQGSLCAFGDALDAILCDVFLRGLTSKRVHERMLRDSVDGQLPTLDRAFLYFSNVVLHSFLVRWRHPRNLVFPGRHVCVFVSQLKTTSFFSQSL